MTSQVDYALTSKMNLFYKISADSLENIRFTIKSHDFNIHCKLN